MVRSQDVAIKMAMIVGAVVSALADSKDMIVTVPPSAWQPFIGNKNFTKIEKEIGKSLNKKGAGSPNVSTAIKKISDQYSKGKVVL